MPYEHSLSKPFIAPIFIEEDGYWQNCMKPYLEREGWYIAEVDCAGATGSLDFGRRFLTALDFDWDFFPYEFDVHWAFEYATEVDWLDLRQGLFVYYKNFEDVLSMADRLGNDSYAIYAVNIIDSMRLNYPMRPSPRPRSGDDYEVTLGYGFGVSRASLPRVEQFFTGNNEILIAGPEVVEYPWTWHEERKKKYFPQGFPAPRCDERGDWIFDPERYPESPAFTGDAGYPVEE